VITQRFTRESTRQTGDSPETYSEPLFCQSQPVSSALGSVVSFEQMAREVLARKGETKTIVVDPQAT
jgi:hypothetical protein